MMLFLLIPVLRRFLPEEELLSEIESTFMGLYSLDENTPHTEVIARAIKHPELYVMKPQREGGGQMIEIQCIH